MISPYTEGPSIPHLQKSTLLLRQKLALEPLSGQDRVSHVFWLFWQIVCPLPEDKRTPKQKK